MHVRGGEIFSSQVRDPVTELVVTIRDKAAPITVKGGAYRTGGIVAVEVTGGGSGGSRPYFRKRAYRHSCVPSSIPFIVDGCNVIHAPVFVARFSQRVTWTGPSNLVYTRASSASRTIRFRAAVRPSWRQAEWYAVQNSSWPLSTATRLLVMT